MSPAPGPAPQEPGKHGTGTPAYDDAKAAWVAANLATAPPIGPCGKAALAPLLDTSDQPPSTSVTTQVRGASDGTVCTSVTLPEGKREVTETRAGSGGSQPRGMSARRRSAP